MINGQQVYHRSRLISQWLFLLLALVCYKTAAAQSPAPIAIEMELFNNKQGLSQGFVSSIIQDKTGFLWFATKDGLNRFDGYKVTVYRNNQSVPYSIPDNSIAHLLEDGKGNFWVGTRNRGLLLFDRVKEQFYPVQLSNQNTKINNPVQYLQCHGQYLLAEDYFDICIYDIAGIDPTKAAQYLYKKLPVLFCYNSATGRPVNQLLSGIHWMEDNSIWKASEDSVFICRPDASMRHWKFEAKSFAQLGMGKQRLFAAFSCSQPHQVVLVGSDAIVIYDSLQNKVLYNKALQAANNPPLDYFANTPYKTGADKIMFYDKDGYHLFDAKDHSDKLYVVDERNAKTGLGGLSHLVDRSGTLWSGSIGYGIYKYNFKRELFHVYPEDCKSLFIDAPGNLYVNFRSGASKFSSTAQQKLPLLPAQLWRSNWKNPLLFCNSRQGNLWLQVTDTYSGQNLLLKYNAPEQTITDCTHLLNTLPGAQLLYSFADREGNFWQLMYCIDRSRRFQVSDPATNQVIATYTIPQEKDVNRVSSFLNSVLEDQSGNFWFCTNRGLLFFNRITNHWKAYYNRPADTTSLSSDIVFSACADPKQPDQYLWVGTNGGGLNRMNLSTGKCKRYSEKNGLPNDVIYGILHDDFGNLWLSTNQGLSCFNIQKETFRNYAADDGLAGNEFNRGQFLKTADGTLFFGGVDGITWFKPADLLKAVLPANNIVITGLSIFNNPVDHRIDSNILQQPIQYTRSITLPYAQNMFTIEFALLEHCKPEKKMYRYFLEGFDKTWIENGSKNTATYTNLDPGEYTFHVIGRNSDGIWNDKGVSIVISITPPWYRTWWFRILLGIVISISLYAFYRYQLHQRLKVIKMRNVIASDLHDEIGSTISSITVYSDIIRDKTIDPDLSQIAGRISESSANILVAMSDIVWSINPLNDRFDNILIRMKSFAHEVLDAQNKTLYFEADDSLNDIKLQMNNRKNFYLIFKEALNNAVKYAQASSIRIHVSLLQKEVLFSIEDDGLGFDIHSHKEGNGIVNMHRRSKDLGGTLVMESVPGEGTSITLRFPV